MRITNCTRSFDHPLAEHFWSVRAHFLIPFWTIIYSSLQLSGITNKERTPKGVGNYLKRVLDGPLLSAPNQEDKISVIYLLRV